MQPIATATLAALGVRQVTTSKISQLRLAFLIALLTLPLLQIIKPEAVWLHATALNTLLFQLELAKTHVPTTFTRTRSPDLVYLLAQQILSTPTTMQPIVHLPNAWLFVQGIFWQTRLLFLAFRHYALRCLRSSPTTTHALVSAQPECMLILRRERAWQAATVATWWITQPGVVCRSAPAIRTFLQIGRQTNV